MQCIQLTLPGIQRRLHNDAHVQRLGLGYDQRRKLGEVRHLQIRHGQTDNTGVTGTQIAGGDVDLVPQLFDGAVHFGARSG